MNAHSSTFDKSASADKLALAEPAVKTIPQTTKLTTAAKRDFESILGARDVSDDPAIVSSYAWNAGFMSFAPPEMMITPNRPVAVVLPESTEEVRDVVRACIRHGYRFRPHSTGHATFANVAHDNVIAIDLRKMDRIIEIDANNQMAVIEPYVTAQQLQAESLKVGLTPHIIGAGWTHSPLASATAFVGVGPSGNHTGQNVRNLLSLEWVTPQGEIVRVGSAGSGLDWFGGDGPGPGLRGMIRGNVGTAGELGVFTRIGYKLHPWMGPPKLEHRGIHPQWGIPLNETMRLYHIVWPDWQAVADATFDLLHANVATYVTRLPSDHQGWMLYTTNREFYERWTSGDIAEIARNENRFSWTITAVSESGAEAEWRERVILSIVEKTGARLVELDPAHAEMLARNAVTSCYVPRVQRAATRGLFTTAGILDSPRLLPKVMERAERTMKPYKEKYGTLGSGSPESFWTWTSEGRHLWGENIVAGDNSEPKSWADAMGYVMRSALNHALKPFGNNTLLMSKDLLDLFATKDKANIWMRKMRNAFDPDFNGDTNLMPYGPISPLRKVWPVMQAVIRYLPQAFRSASRGQFTQAHKAARAKAAQLKADLRPRDSTK